MSSAMRSNALGVCPGISSNRPAWRNGCPAKIRQSRFQRLPSNRNVLPRLTELLDAHLTTITEKIGELEALRDEIRSYREHVARRLLEGGDRD